MKGNKHGWKPRPPVCAPHAARVKATFRAVGFLWSPWGQEGWGAFRPHAAVPSQPPQLLHLEVAARTALPDEVCASQQVTPGTACYSLAGIAYQTLCRQLYPTDPLNLKITQVETTTPRSTTKKREVLDIKEIKLSWKYTHKHQVQTGLAATLYWTGSFNLKQTPLRTERETT